MALFWSASLLFLRKKNLLASFFFQHVYWYLPCTFIDYEIKIPLDGLILVCKFNVFLRIFLPARLFRPTCLFGILEYTILYTRVVLTGHVIQQLGYLPRFYLGICTELFHATFKAPQSELHLFSGGKGREFRAAAARLLFLRR